MNMENRIQFPYCIPFSILGVWLRGRGGGVSPMTLEMSVSDCRLMTTGALLGRVVPFNLQRLGVRV